MSHDTEPAMYLTYQCGCGFRVKVVSTTLASEAGKTAMAHVEATGHTMEVQGTIQPE